MFLAGIATVAEADNPRFPTCPRRTIRSYTGEQDAPATFHGGEEEPQIEDYPGFFHINQVQTLHRDAARLHLLDHSME